MPIDKFRYRRKLELSVWKINKWYHFRSVPIFEEVERKHQRQGIKPNLCNSQNQDQYPILRISWNGIRNNVQEILTV